MVRFHCYVMADHGHHHKIHLPPESFSHHLLQISFPLNFDLNQSSFIFVSSLVWIKTALHHNEKVLVLLTNCFKTFFKGLALVAYIALEISTNVTFRVGNFCALKFLPVVSGANLLSNPALL